MNKLNSVLQEHKSSLLTQFGLVLVILFSLLGSILMVGCNICIAGGNNDCPQSGTQPTQPVLGNTSATPVNSTNTSGEACLGERDYPITGTLSGLSSGFYRIEFYIGNGPENESWLPAGPGVSYNVNSNTNGHVWEFPSVSCTNTDMMNDAIASHRRRSTRTTVSSSDYVDPNDPLVTSNFIKQ